MAKYEEWLADEKLILIEGWARDGLINEQIAHNMGISSETLRVWCKKYPAISAALKKGKEVADREVENALFKKATGYEYTETVIEEITYTDAKVRTYKKIIKKHAQPDVTAQIFWLKNRKPSKWRDKADIDVNPESLNKAKELLGDINSVID